MGLRGTRYSPTTTGSKSWRFLLSRGEATPGSRPTELPRRLHDEGTDYEALAQLAQSRLLPPFSRWDRKRDSACVLATSAVTNVKLTWVLARDSNGQYEEVILSIARMPDGGWTLTPLLMGGEWHPEAFERPDHEWDGWGPVIDLSESGARSAEDDSEKHPKADHSHPPTSPFGYLAIKGVAAKQLRSVTIRTSEGREATESVDPDSGAFLVATDAVADESVVAVEGLTHGGTTIDIE